MHILHICGPGPSGDCVKAIVMSDRIERARCWSINIVPDHSKPLVVWTGNEEAHVALADRDLIVVAPLGSLADRKKARFLIGPAPEKLG